MTSMFKKGWKPIAVLILLLFIWELAVKLADLPKWLLPAPSSIWEEAVKGFEQFLPHMQSTIVLATVGFVIGCSVGLVVAIALHLLPGVREAIYPLLILSQNVPIIVLAPLLVIWFGFGLLPKMIVITLVCFFPVTIAALGGFRNTPSEMKHYMLMAGASKIQLFSKLEWPNALPALFSGLKISATYSVMGAVISEWLGAKNGIGVYMTLASSSFRTERVFVAIIAVMILSLLFFCLITAGERQFVKWGRKEER
ncbi:ABC transporter permease [Lederbergia lenta]|uniref:Binding-protein-dependent transport system inner membrane protein n=1 Tax=Lederbergia lenta TaxID=1467 RepID=A0A2X4VM26_LEDLE|nr:ABC transporter permease [Lederbergia lenta]MCM3112322.1 ABC transporter permease [Lederbergia lenta]MEC2326542.1 ABC transporter permease [Lederbergia lenta]SQI53207.1 binding-protein-dependent transport system inner membrane protein [Lederbergia lenta]